METGEAPIAKKRKRTAQQTAKIIERGSRILELRKNGASLRAISAVLKREAEERGESTRGYSYEQVRRDFNEIVALRIEEQQDALEEIRVICCERLEDVVLNYMPYAKSKIGPLTDANTVKMKMKAGDTIIKAVKELSEIYGAKRPQKLEVTGEDGKPLNVVTQVLIEFTNNIDPDEG